MDEKTGDKLLSFEAYRRLSDLIGFLSNENPFTFGRLFEFITGAGGRALDDNVDNDTIRVAAYDLMARGYQVETLMRDEYEGLRDLYLVAEPASADDMELHDEGTHRAMYNFITRTLGLSVPAGRGPVYRRANKLLNFNAPTMEPTP